MALPENSYKKHKLLQKINYDDHRFNAPIESIKRNRIYPRKHNHEFDDSPNNPFLSILQTINITQHADLRLAQRNLSLDDIKMTLLYGTSRNCAGAVIIYLRQKDIPHDEFLHNTIRRLVGTTIVLNSKQDFVLTAYRNKNGFREVLKKPIYDRLHFDQSKHRNKF